MTLSVGSVILILQVAGFLVALLFLAIGAPPPFFVLAFGVHLIGDLLRTKVEGIPQMPFNLEQYIKVAPWLQFVGYALAVGGLLSLNHWIGKPLAYVGLFVSFAGFLYKKIYP
jgi:hypothetical protein